MVQSLDFTCGCTFLFVKIFCLVKINTLKTLPNKRLVKVIHGLEKILHTFSKIRL